MNNIMRHHCIHSPRKINITSNKILNIKDINIRYGIDENGNPINISEYFKKSKHQKSQSLKIPKLVAYIIKDNQNKNILIDLNGNPIINKNKDGDYDHKLEKHIIIKDFDVKNPELRINGESNKNINSEFEFNELNKNIHYQNKNTLNNIFCFHNFNIKRSMSDHNLFNNLNKTGIYNNNNHFNMKFRYDSSENDNVYKSRNKYNDICLKTSSILQKTNRKKYNFDTNTKKNNIYKHDFIKIDDHKININNSQNEKYLTNKTYREHTYKNKLLNKNEMDYSIHNINNITSKYNSNCKTTRNNNNNLKKTDMEFLIKKNKKNINELMNLINFNFNAHPEKNVSNIIFLNESLNTNTTTTFNENNISNFTNQQNVKSSNLLNKSYSSKKMIPTTKELNKQSENSICFSIASNKNNITNSNSSSSFINNSKNILKFENMKFKRIEKDSFKLQIPHKSRNYKNKSISNIKKKFVENGNFYKPTVTTGNQKELKKINLGKIYKNSLSSKKYNSKSNLSDISYSQFVILRKNNSNGKIKKTDLMDYKPKKLNIICKIFSRPIIC